ncbi:hypothetical protein CBS101457_000256 [Exobasidium rhododendri]|nr:hypothetical protein CBS101457_000256 [Exobasidium rhododendri]
MAVISCLYGCGHGAPLPSPMNPWDGSQTSRLSSEEAQRLYRQQRRQNQNQGEGNYYHGVGGDYATTTSHQTPYYPNLFSQSPENLGSGNYQVDQGGSSSSSSSLNQQFGQMGVHDYSQYGSGSGTAYGQYGSGSGMADYGQYGGNMYGTYSGYPPSHDYNPYPYTPYQGHIVEEEEAPNQPLVTTRRNYQDEDLVWEARNGDAQNQLAEIVSVRRGYTLPYARQELAKGLTKRLYKELKSDNEDTVNSAITELFPIDDNTALPIWMGKMNLKQSEDFVRRIWKNTSEGVRKDTIRDRLRFSQMDADTAYNLQEASKEKIVALAYSLGLQTDEEDNTPKHEVAPKKPKQARNVPDWMHNLDYAKQDRVIGYIMEVFKEDYDAACETLHLYRVGTDLVKAIRDARKKSTLESVLYGMVHGAN